MVRYVIPMWRLNHKHRSFPINGYFWAFSALLFIALGGCRKDSSQPAEVDEAIIAPPNSLFHTSVPRKAYDIILLKPTASSVTLSILSYKTCEAKVEFALQGVSALQTVQMSLKANVPFEVELSALSPNSSYHYRYSYKTASSAQYIQSPEYVFRTARAGSSSFVFDIQADSHLDMNTDTTVYRATLDNIASDHPDFLVDMGDTFMNDKYGKDFSMALYNYIAQRYFFGTICHSLPLFYVQGNHDGEMGMYNDGTAQSWAAWSNQTRKKYFPMPEPDAFYAGNTQQDANCGYLQDYYAWEWSNALFIVLDPFWYTPASGNNKPWDRTLGQAQYDWLENTLKDSQAKFKFVFIHNLVGGQDNDGKGRGGAEAAYFYEWGGHNADSTDGFVAKRPGWALPIHDMLVKYGVKAVFHGHDHFFGRQLKDGIIYQELPQPSVDENFKPIQAAGYGYLNGTILGGSGYLRLTVGQDQTKVEYVGTFVKTPGKNRQTVYGYTIL